MDSEEQISAAARKKSAALIFSIVRASGAALMLLGTAIGFNLGDIASLAGISDSLTVRIAGGAIFTVGLLDFLVIPHILLAKINPQ